MRSQSLTQSSNVTTVLRYRLVNLINIVELQMELLGRSETMLILTTVVTVILVIKVYQTVNITLYSSVSSTAYKQGVATEWIAVLQNGIPGLMLKNIRKKQITSLKMHHASTQHSKE